MVLLALFLGAACKGPEKDVQASGMQAGTFSLKGGAGPATYDSSTDSASQFDGDVDDSDTALTFGVGYTVHPNLSLELAYTDFGELTYDGTWNGTPIEGAVESTGVSLAAVGHYPLNETFGLVGTLGVLAWQAEDDENFGGVDMTYDDDGTDPFYGAGVQATIGGHLGARLDYTFYEIWDEDVETILLTLLYYF